MDKDNISTGTKIFTAYTVEVKVEHFIPHRPVTLDDNTYGRIIITNEWRKVDFDACPQIDAVLVEAHHGICYVMPYAAAMALSWTLVALHGRYEGMICRVVPVECTVTHEVKKSDKEPEELCTGLTKALKDRKEKENKE